MLCLPYLKQNGRNTYKLMHLSEPQAHSPADATVKLSPDRPHTSADVPLQLAPSYPHTELAVLPSLAAAVVQAAAASSRSCALLKAESIAEASRGSPGGAAPRRCSGMTVAARHALSRPWGPQPLNKAAREGPSGSRKREGAVSGALVVREEAGFEVGVRASIGKEALHVGKHTLCCGSWAQLLA
jgi:hypothetical protein